MTCHNGEEYLNEAITSIINQKFKNWELIFYDNYSKDRSKEIIYAFTDKRIKYFRSDKLLNLGQVRNLAYNKTNGEFITFLDVDDTWNEDKLSSQIKKFEKDQNIDVIYCDYKKFSSKNYNIRKKNLQFVKGFCQEKIINSYIDGKPITPWLTLMIKKKKINELEYAFDKNLHISSDFDLIIRLSDFCYFDYIPEVLCNYRIHESNTSLNKTRELSELSYILNKYNNNKKIKEIFKRNLFFIKVKVKNILYKILSYI